MAGEWPKVTIESLLESGAITGHKDGNHGSDYPRVEEFGTSGVPFLTAKSLSEGRLDVDGAPRLADDKADRLHFGFLKPGDVLLSHNATIGRVGIVPDFTGRLLIGTSLTYFRLDNSRIFPRYLAAYFSGADFQNQLAAVMSHTTRNQIPITAQRQLQIVLPPLAQQKAIAAVLGVLDDKIELNRRMNETLEAMARTLFQSWFVDFDPVRAKAEGRDPGLPKHLAELLPDSFEESELGKIPTGWPVSTIGDIADVVDCLHSKKPERQPGGRPLLQLGNIRDDGLLDMGDTYFISARDFSDWTSRLELREGDCMITNVGRVGAVGQVPAGLVAALGRNMTGVRCRRDHPYPTFLVETLRSSSMREEIIRRTDTGTILDALNVRSIPLLRLPLPPVDMISHFEHTSRPARQRMEQSNDESRTLAALRDTLLPKLISGELRIEDAERFLEKTT